MSALKTRPLHLREDIRRRLSSVVVLVWKYVLFIYVERQLWTVDPHDCLLTLLHRRRSAGGKTQFLLPNHWIIRTLRIQRTSLLPITFIKSTSNTFASPFPPTSCWNCYNRTWVNPETLCASLFLWSSCTVIQILDVLLINCLTYFLRSYSRWAKLRPGTSAVSVNSRSGSTNTSAIDTFLIDGQAKLLL